MIMKTNLHIQHGQGFKIMNPYIKKNNILNFDISKRIYIYDW